MCLSPGPAEDVDSKDSRMMAFDFEEEAMLLEEGRMEYIASCQGKSKFCEEQVQDQATSYNLVY